MNEPLAIVGMACRLPGADGLDAFWKLVVEGRAAWGPLPESRLPRDLYFHPEKSRLGKSYSEMGAVVSDRPVDPAVCPITPEMLGRFDVAHTIFLEVASLACRDAGLDPFAMPVGRRTGVYVGHTGGSTRIGDIVYATGIDEAARLLTEVDAARAVLGGDVEAVAADLTDAIRRRYGGREPGTKLDLGALAAAKIVHQALALDGPYLVVDAACASSLQAMAIGARAVLEGSIDQAIVGGASYCKSDSLVLFSAAQSVSNTGSYPFGRDADGLVTAEGYVALVIKTLSRAIADGDRIRAVIRGLGVASDGKGKSLWAPRQEGQVLAVERAYPDPADIARIEYIEAHATSTQVGDATELAALSSLMSRHLPAGHTIPIGSVKANIGHTLETAGIASLVKVVLAMEHGVIPPGTTARALNEEFDWAGGPFSVPFAPLPWQRHADGSPRLAAVNAFGIGGLNVHVALAEHVPAAAPPVPRIPRAGDPEADAIAIVGTGCVLPGALTVEAFYELLDRGDTAIGLVPTDRWAAARALDRSGPRAWHTTSDIGGFVRDFAYDWRRHKVPPKQIAAANPLQFMLLEAADAALADAGGPEAGLDRTRTGVVVGTLFGGDFANQLQLGLRLPETRTYLEAALGRRGVAAADIPGVVEAYEKKVLERYPALVDETGSFTSSTLASRLTKTFDLMGGALALDAGDCSSLAALAAAVDMLRQGTCDAMLCAAGERCMDLMAFEGRSLGGFLADRPVSVLEGATSGGDVAAEGAVVFVLKRLADARAAGNRIHGVIRGLAVTASRSRDEAVSRAIGVAADRAALPQGAVVVTEVAVAGGNKAAGCELQTLVERYAAADTGRVIAGSLDGLVGHLGAAAGAAGLVKLTRAVSSGSLPGTAAVQRPAAGLAAATARLTIPAADTAGYRAGSLTVIQDDQAGHIVIDNGLPVPAAMSSDLSKPLGASDLSKPLGASRGDLPQGSTSIATSASSKPLGASRGDLPRPLVAAIFPGQGSQYTDMFRSLVEEVPVAADMLARLDKSARAAGCQTLAEIAWQPDNGLGTKIWDTQWAMYLGDLLAWGVLESSGFAPDFIASHSFGEFPALAAGGAWSVADGIRATQARAVAVEQLGPRNGAMLSVIADAATVNAAIEPFAGRAWICAANAPEQYVVGGTARVVDAVEVLLESRRVKTKRLAVPSPFHTPLLQASADELAKTLRSLPIAAARTKTVSSTTLRLLDSPAAVLESLVRQMTETVRWIEVVNYLYDAGVRTFVEVGPSGVLSGLSRRILAGRPDATFLQFDQRGRSPAEHLARLREQLAASGCLRSAAVAVAATGTAARPAGRVVAFDATARRRQRNRAAASTDATPARRPLAAATHGAGNGNGHSTPPVNGSGNGHAHPSGNGNGHANGHRNGQDGGHADSHGKGQAAVEGGRSEESTPRAATVVNRLAGVSAAAAPARSVEDRFLDDVVAELIAEHGISLPLGGAAESQPRVRGFLDTIQHLFDVSPMKRSAVVAATTLAGLCDVLAASGGKAEWLPRWPDSAGGTASPAAGSGDSSGELETFLVEFVVEQTGYPAEIVELDADLEADLGIDSIRKAQLFGEVGQRYGLAVEDGVSLDDFPTLRHLIDYLLPRVGGRAAAPRAVEPAEPAMATTTAVAALALAEELETFLIEFVVEQTGYPAEIVELDADLEADLGIDSIRKAQLFGEIGQRYGLAAEDGVSLDDFPTLRHLIDYLLPRLAANVGDDCATDVSGSDPAADAAFARGLDSGRRHAAAIRAWARQIAASIPLATGVAVAGELIAEAAGIAAGAGVDEAVVQAGMAAPAAALGGCDIALVAPPASTQGTAGILACFGRYAEPTVSCFNHEGLTGTLVGVPGLSGGLLGWNDTGLVAFVAMGSGTDVPPGPTIERIVTTCRSLADARAVLEACPVAPRGIVIASPEGGEQVAAGGELVVAGASVRRAEPRGPLVRVALADGALAADAVIGRLLAADPAAADALSSVCTWLAVGGGFDSVASGGPRGRDWLARAEGLGPRWIEAAPAGRDSAAADGVTQRYELELRDAGSVRVARSLAGQRVAILGDGRLAVALEALIAARGGQPVVLEPAALADPEAAAFAVARAEANGSVQHLVVLAPPATETSPLAIAPAFATCQKWIAARARAGDLAGATLTAVCDLGGFGLAGPIAAPVGGGLAGLFKGIAREFADLHVRVLDAAATLPAETLAAAVLDEMTDAAGPVEIARVGGRRLTVAAVARPAAAPAPQPSLERGGCWLVTGGARGVTAACVRELGRRHGVSLVLVGSTQPVPVRDEWLAASEADLRDLKGRVMLEAKGRGEDPRRAWTAVEKSIEIARSLAALANAGVTARYEACDLVDAAAVESLVDRVHREVGPVRGIVHGAGWESACRFEKKTLDALAKTVGPKCVGLENLLAAIDTAGDPQALGMLVAFGSTSGRLGGHGQADYSLANDMLAKLVAAARQTRPGLRATTFHWHAWDEVGMASRPESRFVLEQFGLKFMPLAEGVRRFMAEVEAGLPVAEVLVTEPAMVAHAMAAVSETAVATPPRPKPVAAEPLPARAGSLVERITAGPAGSEVVFRLDPLADRFLVDHLQYGRPLLPAVMGAELVAQAAVAAGLVERVGEIRDFVVERPLNFPVDQAREVRVEVEPTGAARGLAQVLGPDGKPTVTERVHFRGRVSPESAEPVTFEVGEPPFPFNPMVYQEAAPMRHGPSFRTLDGLFLDRSGGWARLTAPRGDGVAAPRGLRGWTVPAALLDGVIVGCAVYSYILCGRRVEIPVRFDRLRIASQPRPGETCTSRMLFREQSARETIYDVVVAGEGGRPILVVDGLHLAVMAGERSPPA